MNAINLVAECAMRRQQLLDNARIQGNPGGVVQEIRELVAAILGKVFEMEAADRAELISLLTRSDSEFLHTLAMNGAVFAVREQSRDRLREGLMALVIEDRREDARETTMQLCLLCHSATIIGEPIEEVFEDLRQYASPDTAKYIDSYFSGGNRDIAAMGYCTRGAGPTFLYRQIRW